MPDFKEFLMDFQPEYEYRTTFALVPQDFPNHPRLAEDLARINPKPPKGENWQLVSSASTKTDQGAVIYYYWERNARERRAAPRNAG